MAYIKTFIIIKKWYQCRFTLRHATSSDPHLEHKSQQCMFQSINSFQVENTHMIFTSLKFSFLIWEMEILIIELCLCVCARSVIQSCLTLCDPIDYIPPVSSARGISQAGILEWVAISSSRGSSGTRDKPASPVSPALADWFFPAEQPRKSNRIVGIHLFIVYKELSKYLVPKESTQHVSTVSILIAKLVPRIEMPWAALEMICTIFYLQLSTS